MSADPKFYLKKPETPKTSGGYPRNVDPRTQKADPEARTQPDPNFCSLITSLLWVQEFITFMRNNIHVKVKVIAYLFIVFMWIFSAL